MYVALLTATITVALKNEIGPTRRNSAIELDRAIWLAHGRAKAQFAGGTVQGVMAVVGPRIGKVGHFRPGLGRLTFNLNGQGFARFPFQDGRGLQLEALAGRAIALPQKLSRDLLGMGGGNGAPPRGHRNLAQPWRFVIRPHAFAVLGWRNLFVPYPHPVQFFLFHVVFAHLWQVNLDPAGGIHGFGGVAFTIAGLPARLLLSG